MITKEIEKEIAEAMNAVPRGYYIKIKSFPEYNLYIVHMRKRGWLGSNLVLSLDPCRDWGIAGDIRTATSRLKMKQEVDAINRKSKWGKKW